MIQYDILLFERIVKAIDNLSVWIEHNFEKYKTRTCYNLPIGFRFLIYSSLGRIPTFKYKNRIMVYPK